MSEKIEECPRCGNSIGWCRETKLTVTVYCGQGGCDWGRLAFRSEVMG